MRRLWIMWLRFRWKRPVHVVPNGSIINFHCTRLNESINPIEISIGQITLNFENRNNALYVSFLILIKIKLYLVNIVPSFSKRLPAIVVWINNYIYTNLYKFITISTYNNNYNEIKKKCVKFGIGNIITYYNIIFNNR